MGKCNINLAVTFESTADTDRLRALEIAGLVRRFIQVQMDAANVKVEVHGAMLNYAEAWEQARDEQYPNQGFAEGVADTFNANRPGFGNPDTDKLN